MDRTLALIKPDAVEALHVGSILMDIEWSTHLQIVEMKRVHVSLEKARALYVEHTARPYFEALTGFVASGPLVVLALEGHRAVATWRELMKKIRGLFADREVLYRNTVHGSDSAEAAEREIRLFFPELSYSAETRAAIETMRQIATENALPYADLVMAARRYRDCCQSQSDRQLLVGLLEAARSLPKLEIELSERSR